MHLKFVFKCFQNNLHLEGEPGKLGRCIFLHLDNLFSGQQKQNDQKKKHCTHVYLFKSIITNMKIVNLL